MLKYDDLYKMVEEDTVADSSAYDSEYMIHWVEKTKNKVKWRCDHGGQLRRSDGLRNLLGALDSNNGGVAGGTAGAM